jgi:hypothetical protein
MRNYLLRTELDKFVKVGMVTKTALNRFNILMRLLFNDDVFFLNTNGLLAYKHFPKKVDKSLRGLTSCEFENATQFEQWVVNAVFTYNDAHGISNQNTIYDNGKQIRNSENILSKRAR